MFDAKYQFLLGGDAQTPFGFQAFGRLPFGRAGKGRGLVL
jgi:hypothetical protein